MLSRLCTLQTSNGPGGCCLQPVSRHLPAAAHIPRQQQAAAVNVTRLNDASQQQAARISSSSRRHQSRRTSTVSHDSSAPSQTTTISTVSTNNVPRAAPHPQQQPADSSVSQEQEQEIKGLKQLLLQQQEMITALQRDMQDLKSAMLRQPGSSNDQRPQQQQQQGSTLDQRLQWAEQQSRPTEVPLSAPPPPHLQQGAAPQQQQHQQQATAAGLASQPQAQEQLNYVGQRTQTSQQQQQKGGYQPMALETFQSLPDKIILVRHAESLGNVDATTYRDTPDYEVPLSARGWEQAVACGNSLRTMMDVEHGNNYKLFFMTSPYCRTRQTFVGIRQAFPDENFAGVQEEVQLREQDFGNFQNPAKIQADLAERNRFGRFYYRFPDGESGSDVYNRVSIFEDHLIRDMKASRFSSNTSLCMVTHGLTMRVFLMRWFNWTVESFLQVYNPPNATPIIVDKISEVEYLQQIQRLRDKRQTLQVKHAYRLRSDSKRALKMNAVATTDHIDLVHHNYLQ